METTVNLKKEALKNGAIWGAINIVIFLVTWYAMPTLMSSYWYVGISVIIGILLAVYFCIELRKKAGGYWSFSEALWPIVAMFLMNMTLVFLFTIAFGKFIDPTYPVKMKEISMESTAKLMETIGGDEATVAQEMSKAEERFDKQFNPDFKEGVFQYGLSAIMYFVFALIFTLIFKKNNPNPWGETAAEDSVKEE
ncbi:MAG: DUF4199 domain-containing protein [Bacteroidota bacterium]